MPGFGSNPSNETEEKLLCSYCTETSVDFPFDTYNRPSELIVEQTGKCRVCSGTGASPIHESRACPACGGTGHCPHCSGELQVELSPEIQEEWASHFGTENSFTQFINMVTISRSRDW